MFQQLPDALLGCTLDDVLPAAALESWIPRIRRVFLGETSHMTEALERDDSIYAVTLFPLRDQSGAVRFAGGLAIDVTQSQLAERHLRSTALQVLSAQEAGQERISRFLHDEVGQSLTAAGMQLDILRMDLEATVAGISERTAEVQRMLEVVVDRIRDLSYELNPAIVERAGFHSAMDRLVGRCRRSFKGTVRLMSDSSLRIPTDVGSALYKIAQGAVDNAIQHASCSQIELQVKATQAGPTLEVRDNGRGFRLNGGYRRLGLLLMEHYAGQAGLRLTVESQEGKGTLVRAVWDRNSGNKN
jgi:signal transduction histidine kinase